MTGKDQITLLLEPLSDGKREAVDRLMPLVYEQLPATAKRQRASERSNHTLDSTALVHEAYPKLVDPTRAEDLVALDTALDELGRLDERYGTPVGLPVAARKDTCGYRAQKFARRIPSAVVAVGMVVAAIVGPSEYYTRGPTHRRDPEIGNLMNSLAWVLDDVCRDAGRSEEVWEYYERALRIRERRLPGGDPRTADVRRAREGCGDGN